MELGRYEPTGTKKLLHLDCNVVLMVDRTPYFIPLQEKPKRWICEGCFVRVDRKTMIDLSTERIAQEGD